MASQKLPDFDYVELVVYDVHCRGMAKLLSRSRMPGAYKDGMGLYGGVCYFGMCGQPTVQDDFGVHNNFGNHTLKPDKSTLTRCHEGGDRVGHVICDIFDMNGKRVDFTPRTVAEIQLKRLAQQGLTFKSSSEIEFVIKDAATGKDFAHTEQWSNINVVEVHQDLLLEFLDKLKIADVNVDALQSEYGPGMFEMTCDVATGLKGPDTTARFKSVAKSFFSKKGQVASFMTKSDIERTSSGMHFNHSLYNKEGANVLWSEKAPNKFSELGRHWMAGLVKHGPAITALCCPTINCYRRIGAPWAPVESNWGFNNRCKSFRVKIEGTNIYLENRIPSAASNPYLVLAATVAAGLDGITNKLELPDAKSPSAPLPKDLDSAIRLLEKDEVIVNALGQNAIKHFVYCKRTFELELFKEVESCSDADKFKWEHDTYFVNA